MKGKPQRKGRVAPKASPREREDPDAVDFDSVDWSRVEQEAVELDPALVERIRARSKLKPVTLRIGVEQMAEARRVAARTGAKYQAVLRRWLAEGASRARRGRLHAKR